MGWVAKDRAYVTKPCLPQDLVREVRAVLRRFGRRSA